MTPQEYLDWCKDMSERLEKYEYHFTNADRIRNMTDEDLAKWIDNLLDAQGCPPKSIGNCRKYDECKKCWLDWLRKEIET